MDQTSQIASCRRHRAVALWCAASWSAWSAWPSPPCRSTACSASSPAMAARRASPPRPRRVLDRTVTVRFDANVAPGCLALRAGAAHRHVRIGENRLAFYRATNISDAPYAAPRPSTCCPSGRAFLQQDRVLLLHGADAGPGQTVELPVSFFVDPASCATRTRAAPRTSPCPTPSTPRQPPKPGLAEKPASVTPAAPPAVPGDRRAG